MPIVWKGGAPPSVPSPTSSAEPGMLKRFLAGGMRIGSGALASLPAIEPGIGTVIGAGIAGAGESAAEWIEGRPQNPYRIGTEAALGAVPLGWFLKAGRPLESIFKGGALAAVGEGGRELSEGNGLTPGNIGMAAVMGGAAGGLLARIGMPKAAPYEYDTVIRANGSELKIPRSPAPPPAPGAPSSAMSSTELDTALSGIGEPPPPTGRVPYGGVPNQVSPREAKAIKADNSFYARLAKAAAAKETAAQREMTRETALFDRANVATAKADKDARAATEIKRMQDEARAAGAVETSTLGPETFSAETELGRVNGKKTLKVPPSEDEVGGGAMGESGKPPTLSYTQQERATKQRFFEGWKALGKNDVEAAKLARAGKDPAAFTPATTPLGKMLDPTTPAPPNAEFGGHDLVRTADGSFHVVSPEGKLVEGPFGSEGEAFDALSRYVPDPLEGMDPGLFKPAAGESPLGKAAQTSELESFLSGGKRRQEHSGFREPPTIPTERPADWDNYPPEVVAELDRLRNSYQSAQGVTKRGIGAEMQEFSRKRKVGEYPGFTDPGSTTPTDLNKLLKLDAEFDPEMMARARASSAAATPPTPTPDWVTQQSEGVDAALRARGEGVGNTDGAPPVPPTPPAPASSSPTGMPAFISRKVEQELLKRGYTQEAINKMKPADAQVILNSPPPKGDGGFSVGSGLGGAQDIAGMISRNPQFSARMALGGVGGLIGGFSDPLGNPLLSAAAGFAAGAAIPSIPAVLKSIGTPERIIDELPERLSTPEGVHLTATDIARAIPDVQRANYLWSVTGLPANVAAGPWGSGMVWGLEMGLSGDPRGWALVRRLINPMEFLRGIEAAMPDAKAAIMHGDAGRGETSILNNLGPKAQFALKGPGTLMTSGDMSIRRLGMDVGFSEEEMRRATMTSNPELPAFETLSNFGKTSPFLQFLLPFRKTLANIGEQGALATPGLGALLQAKRQFPDPMAQQLVQQMLLTPAIAGGSYELGRNVDPETARLMQKYVSNVGGKYSLAAGGGFAAGQAARAGRPAGVTGMVDALNSALPLPTARPITDLARFFGGGMQPKDIPSGAYPAILRDLKTMFSPTAATKTPPTIPSRFLKRQ